MERKKYKREWAARHREQLNAYQRAYYKKHRTKKRAQARARWRNDRERLLARSRLQYAHLMSGRPKKCECCGRTQKRALAKDHNHITGKFRGWLCNQCNTGIGHLGDSKHGVQLALRYLETRT